MIDSDNPAGRLYLILTQARHLTPTPDSRNEQALAELFDVRDTKKEQIHLDVVHGLVELLKLVDETQEALRKTGVDTALYLRAFPHIKDTLIGILGHLNGKWGSYHPNIEKVDFISLEFCADKLSQYPTEKPIEQADFDAILKDVQELFDDVNREGMPPDLRAFILDSLESIRRAIAEYRIRGAERLKEELGAIAGAIVINYQIIEPLKDTPEVSKFYTVLNKFRQIVMFAKDAWQLAEPIVKLLKPGDPASRN